MTERVRARTTDLRQFFANGAVYRRHLIGMFADLEARRSTVVSSLGHVPSVDWIDPFRELVAEATFNDEFVATIHDALVDYAPGSHPATRSGEALASIPSHLLDRALEDADYRTDGEDRSLDEDLLTALDSRQLDDHRLLVAYGMPPLQAEMLVSRNDLQAERFIDGIRLTDLNQRIAGWAGTDNDPMLDRLVAERNDLLRRLTASEDYWTNDPEIVAVAARFDMGYDEAEFAVTTATVDALAAEIDGWTGHPNDGRYTDLQVALGLEIDRLAEGDGDLARHVAILVDRGVPAGEALFDAVGATYGDAPIATVLQLLEDRAGDPEAFDPIGWALGAALVQRVEAVTRADVSQVDIGIAAVAEENGLSYNAAVALINIDIRAEDSPWPPDTPLHAYLDVPVTSGEEAAFMLLADEEGLFRAMETADQADLDRWDGKLADADWAAILADPAAHGEQALAIATFFSDNPDEWLRFDTARDGMVLQDLAAGRYGVGDGDGVASFADVQQYVTNNRIYETLSAELDRTGTVLVDLDGDGRFEDSELEDALGRLEGSHPNLEGLTEAITYALDADLLSQPDDRAWYEKIGSGLYTITSLVPGSPTNIHRMVTEPTAVLGDQFSFLKGAGTAVVGLGLFVYDAAAVNPGGPGFWIERWRVDGDPTQHRGIRLVQSLPAMADAGLSLLPGTSQYDEAMEQVRRSGTWDAHPGLDLVRSVADWEGFVENPAGWAGQFAPDLLITAFTGGGGAITRVGSTGSRMAAAARRFVIGMSGNGMRVTARTALRNSMTTLAALPQRGRHVARLALPDDGSLYLMGPQDPFLLNAARRPDINPDGMLDVVAHGNSSAIRFDTPDGQRLLTAQEAADHIRSQPGFDGQPIRLLSCETGCDPTGFAQQLSDLLDVPVHAPNQLLWAYPDGRLTVASRTIDPLTGHTIPTFPPDGEFVPFHPLPPLAGPGDGPVDPAILERQIRNRELLSGDGFEVDLLGAGVDHSDIELMFAKRKPLGFASEQQFARFNEDLAKALGDAGLVDAEIGLKGTATTFYSENPGKPLGHHWDADPANPGDYDLNITSERMVETLTELGLEPHPTYGVFRTRHINGTFPALDEFRERWTRILGRDVNFVGYPEPTGRDVTEYILVGER